MEAAVQCMEAADAAVQCMCGGSVTSAGHLLVAPAALEYLSSRGGMPSPEPVAEHPSSEPNV